jgi:hypothetical protein
MTGAIIIIAPAKFNFNLIFDVLADSIIGIMITNEKIK